MRTCSSLRVVLCVLAAVWLGGAVAVAASYEETVATAKALVAEKSWAKAQEAYAAALAVAPDAEAKRWCELGRVDAGWREAGDNAGNEALLARIAEFENLLERYQKPGTEKDAFWFAAMESWADFRAARYLQSGRFERMLEEAERDDQFRRTGDAAVAARRAPRSLDVSSPPDADRLAICEALGEQPPTPDTRQRYLDGVRALVTVPQRNWDRTLLGRLVEQVRTASRVTESADDRAWFALVAQLLTAPQADTNAAKAAQWRTVLDTAKGTKWEALAAGAEFCWRAASGWEPEQAAGTPVDLAARVRECDALLARLWPELKIDQPLSAVDWTDGEKAMILVHGGETGWLPEVVLALGNWRSQWSNPKIELSLPGQVKPGESIAGYFGATAVDGVEFTLVRLTPEEWLQHERAWLTSGKLGKEPTGEVLRRWSVATDLAAQLGFRSGAVDLGATLAPGFYLVTAEGRAKERVVRTTSRFLVTGVEVALLTDYFKPAEVYCVDATTRRPVQGATITGIVGDWMDEEAQTVSGLTDAAGRAPLTIKDAGGSHRARLIGRVGDQPFAIEWDGIPSVARVPPFDGDVILDREVYRPGETVRWKLVLRDQQDGRFKIPPPGTKLKVTAGVGDTTLFKEREFELNAYGTVAGEVTLPATVELGYGRLSFAVVDAPKRRIWMPGSSSSFRVEQYRPASSAVNVELASPPETLRPGGEAAFRVMARYLSGGPMAGADVQCRITFESGDAGDTGREIRAPRAGRSAAMPKPFSVRATTDLDGAAVLRCGLPADLPEGTAFKLDGAVLPVGMAEVKFRRSAFVTKSGYLCAPRFDSEAVAVWRGSEAKFEAQVLVGDQRLAAGFVGMAQIVACRWNEVWRLPDGRIATGDEAQRLSKRVREDGPEETPGLECLHAGYNETVVAEMPVRADAQGNVEVRMAPLKAGIYRLRLLSGGTELYTPEASRRLTVVYDEKAAALELPRNRTTVAVFEPVANGAPLRLFVATASTSAKGWIVINGADRVVAQPFGLNGPDGVLTVQGPPHFDGRGSVEVKLAGNRYRSGETTFATERSDTTLTLGIEPSVSESRPGSDVQIRLRVKGGAASALPAELCVGAVDDAVATLGRAGDWLLSSGFEKRFGPSARLSVSAEGLSLVEEPRDARAGIVAADRWKGRDLRLFGRMSTLSSFAGLDAHHWIAEASKLARSFGARGMPSDAKRPPTLRLRTRFDATAFWAPQVVTDAKGEATVSFNYPDNLTQWRIEAYAVGADGNSFGTATAFTRTSLPFQARLNLPRFLVAGDSAAPSATLVNRTGAALTANAELAVGGAAVATEAEGGRRTGVAVSAQGEATLAWPVRAGNPGTAEFTLKAWAEPESDGMKLSLPVLEDGILQETAASGQLAGGEKQHELVLALPEPLDPARTTVRVQLSGSRAATVLDALPYLVDYPYDCVEQTLSRFLPAVVAKRTLGELGFDAASVEARILGRETPADAARRAKTAGLGRLDEVVAKSLARLSEAQRSDGGFGWWPGASEGDLWMTAYALWGLNLARCAGVEVPPKMLKRASTALTTALGEKKWDWNAAVAADARAWALAAVAGTKLDEREAKRRAEAWTQAYAGRDALTASGRASLALAAATLGTAEERAVLLRNLENGLVRDAATGSGALVHWGSTSGYWRASEGAVEATSLTVLALLELEPQHPLAEPALNWLVLNRRSGNWESTRSTALAVLALLRFMQVRGETLGEAEVEVLANGRASGRVKLNRETLLGGATAVELPMAKLRAGENRIVLRRVAGDGPAYAVALATSWATGDTVKPAGHQAAVARGFVRQKATPTLIGTLRFDPEVLASGGAAKAGEEVQAVVTVTIPNDLEYVMVEVPKPAGCEPLNPLSGWDARIRRVDGAAGGGALRQAQGAADGGHSLLRSEGGEAPSLPQEAAGRAIYREERDEKSVFFLDHLAAGTWEIRYGMRAVTVGDYRALPVQVEAMYVPEIRANSDPTRLRIEKRE